MSSNQSFQLPDLLGIVSTLELRTNKHCRFATDASEKWFAEGITPFRSAVPAEEVVTTTHAPLLCEIELKYLRSTKLGLLCALCFPMCDAPQLRVMTDLVTILFYSAMRESCSREGVSLWSDAIFSSTSLTNSKTGTDMLKEHHFLRHILDQPMVKHALSKAPESWTNRTTTSVRALLDAQKKNSARKASQENDLPITLEEYIEIRRELHGASVMLDFAELLEVFKFPDVQPPLAENLARLKRAALDVLAWSMDVASYQLNQSRGQHQHHFDLISVLMSSKNLSLQGAMNLSGNMIKDAFAEFCTAEKDILDYLDPPPAPALLPATRSTLSLSLSKLSSSASTFFSWALGAKKEDSQSSSGISPSPSSPYNGGGGGGGLQVNTSNALSPSPSTIPRARAPSIAISISSSLSSSSLSICSNSSTDISEIDHAIVKRYIEALKDCLIGTVHWAYETELFFGKKGAEVRAFGWVFVDQVPVIPTS